MTLDTILDQLKLERDRLDRAIAALEGKPAAGRGRRKETGQDGKRNRRRISAATRKRMSESKKKWWAKRKKAKGA